MTFLLTWKYSPQFSATLDDSIGPQDFHAYSDPRSTQSEEYGHFMQNLCKESLYRSGFCNLQYDITR